VSNKFLFFSVLSKPFDNKLGSLSTGLISLSTVSHQTPLTLVTTCLTTQI